MSGERNVDHGHRVPGSEGRSAGDPERAIRAGHERGDHEEAVTVAMNAYGRELFRFLRATLGNDADAGDVSSDLWLQVWTSFPGFQWRSSFRTWAYSLARHCCARFRQSPYRRRAAPLGDTQISRLELQMRSTLWYLKDDVRDQLASLRERLDPDQRALLYLRIDQNLPWEEIAAIMLGSTADPSATATIRQRFTRLKRQMRKMAQESGLLPDDG